MKRGLLFIGGEQPHLFYPYKKQGDQERPARLDAMRVVSLLVDPNAITLLQTRIFVMIAFCRTIITQCHYIIMGEQTSANKPLVNLLSEKKNIYCEKRLVTDLPPEIYPKTNKQILGIEASSRRVFMFAFYIQF